LQAGAAMSALTFTVIGHPEPAGSKKAFVNRKTGRAQVVDANRKSAPWKQQVAGLVASQAPEQLLGPVFLELTFVMHRPKSHFGSGKNAGVLKASAPNYPAVRPDTTKLVRGVEDALTEAGLWRDDAQVVEQLARKLYGSPERVEIKVWELAPNALAVAA
jgi:Holliday junction resolvase RusA-like endonuclease